MNFIIVEDETLYAQQLEMLVEKLGYNLSGVAEDAETALKLFNKQKPDIALIDINLKGEMNGLELGKWLKRFDEKVIIIYITSLHDEKHFEEAKEMAAFSYLTKPVEQTTLKRTIQLATEHFKNGNKKDDVVSHEYLFVKNRSKHIRVKQADILFIEADDKYCNIYFENRKKLTERITLTDINKKLDPKLFAQTHRSFIVNLSKVEEIDSSDMTIKLSKHYVALGESFKQYFMKRIGV